MEEKITISLERYNELIRAEQRAEQYKIHYFENSQINKLNQFLCAIEQKNLGKIMEEYQKYQNREEK